MRTEYTVKITDEKGKIQTAVYPLKYAYEHAKHAAMIYKNKKVELFKVTWNGASFVKAEKIEF